MVAEVEIRNTVESVKMGSNYPPYTTDANIPMITGWLENDGQLLNVDVNRELVSGYARVVYLYYAVVDTSNRKVDYNLIKVADPVIGDAEATAYSFDISTVLTIPRRVSRVVDVNEITIDLFTYEANITDSTGTAIYGQKRLSVPYKAVTDASVIFPTSTDGWFPIGVVDYKYKNMDALNTIIFKKGDLVYWYTEDTESVVGTGVYKCLSNTTSSPVSEGLWILATNADIMKFYTIPPPHSLTSAATIVGANAIVSRYIKKTYISNLLTRISYKDNDDKLALYALIKILSMREASILKLEEGNLVAATYMLELIAFEHDSIFAPKQDVLVTLVNSTYTV